MRTSFDVIILGSGPSANSIASACAKAGRSVALIDKREIGGVCALRGCNPKKVLVRAAELVDWARRAQGKLIAPCDVTIDWRQLIEFKREFTEGVTDSKTERFEELGIEVIQGEARFTGRQTLEVNGIALQAESIVLGTGARPATLGIEGEDLVMHSEDFLDTEMLPRRILFVGGGYISLEFAHIARRAGAEVQIYESGPRVLSGFEEDLVDRLVEHSRSLDIAIHTEREVRAIRRGDEGLRVTITSGDETEEMVTDMVVHGGGRVPSVDGLNLEAAEVTTDEQGVVVNAYLQSVSNPNVFATGDVASSGQPKLTPVANEQGSTVARSLTGNRLYLPDYGVVPRVAFTIPALASVGITESQARDMGLAYEVRAEDIREWSSIRKVGGDVAAYKILVEKETDRLLGAHLLAPDAAETINLFALAMKYGHTATELKSVLFGFPTFAHDVRSML